MAGTGEFPQSDESTEPDGFEFGCRQSWEQCGSQFHSNKLDPIREHEPGNGTTDCTSSPIRICELRNHLLTTEMGLERVTLNLNKGLDQLQLSYAKHRNLQLRLRQRENKLTEMRVQLVQGRHEIHESLIAASFQRASNRSQCLASTDAKLEVFQEQLERKGLELSQCMQCMAELDSTEKQLVSRVLDLEQQMTSLKEQQPLSVHTELLMAQQKIMEHTKAASELWAQLSEIRTGEWTQGREGNTAVCEQSKVVTEEDAGDKGIQNQSVLSDKSASQIMGSTGWKNETALSEAQTNSFALKTEGNPRLPQESLDGQSVKDACRTVVNCQPSPRPAQPAGNLHDSLATGTIPPYDALLQSVPRVCTTLSQESPAGTKHMQTHKSMSDKPTSQTEEGATDKEIQNRSFSPDKSALQTVRTVGQKNETTLSEAQNSAFGVPSLPSLAACGRSEQHLPDAPKTLRQDLLEKVQSLRDACRIAMGHTQFPPAEPAAGNQHDSLAKSVALPLHSNGELLSRTHSSQHLVPRQPSPDAELPICSTSYHWENTINKYALSPGASHRILDGCRRSHRVTLPAGNLHSDLAGDQRQNQHCKLHSVVTGTNQQSPPAEPLAGNLHDSLARNLAQPLHSNGELLSRTQSPKHLVPRQPSPEAELPNCATAFRSEDTINRYELSPGTSNRTLDGYRRYPRASLPARNLRKYLAGDQHQNQHCKLHSVVTGTIPPYDPLSQSVPSVCTALSQESPAWKKHSQTHKSMCEKAASQTGGDAADKGIQNKSFLPDRSTLQTLGTAGHKSETTPSEAQNSAFGCLSPQSLAACQRIEHHLPDASKTPGKPCLPQELLDGQSVEACRTVVSCPSPQPARPAGTLHDSLASDVAKPRHNNGEILKQSHSFQHVAYTKIGGCKPSPRATMPNLTTAHHSLKTARHSLTTACHTSTTAHHNMTPLHYLKNMSTEYVLSPRVSYRKLDGPKPSLRSTFPVHNQQYSFAANQTQYPQSTQGCLARKPCASYDHICHGGTQSGQTSTQMTIVARSDRRNSNSPLCIPYKRLEGRARVLDRCSSR